MWPRRRAEGMLWALDLETGGLDPRTDAILSIGMVPVRDGCICLGEAWHALLQPVGTVRPDSVRAHQLVPGELRAALPPSEALREVERRLREGRLLVHHAALDVAFLRRAFREAGLRWPRPRVIDTEDLLLRLAARARFLEAHAPEPTLNLERARRALGLPDYPAHDALTDAIAAAELWLAAKARLDGTP